MVEFQYSTNQFTRSLVGTNVLARFGDPDRSSARLSATFLREADSEDFNREFGLTSADSALLVVSGDDVATRSGAERVEYDPEALFVQYVRRPFTNNDGSVDTVVRGAVDCTARGYGRISRPFLSRREWQWGLHPDGAFGQRHSLRVPW